jgi:tetratricopeptide (TPR) repeat protein
MATGLTRDAAEATLQRAMAAIQGNRPVDAERLAQEVLARNPSQPNALHLYGYALLMQERAEEAVPPLEKAHRALRDPAIETQLAIALRKAGREDDALARLRRAAKRKPVFPAAVHELSYMLYSLGRTDEAIEVLQNGIAAAPWMPDLPLLLGWAFHARQDIANAQAAFARALEIAPGHPEALYGLGFMLMETGAFQAASDYFRRVLQANPGDQASRLYLGACLLELGDSAAAASCLRLVTGGGANFYGKALKVLISSRRGRFWLKPSAVAGFFQGKRP